MNDSIISPELIKIITLHHFSLAVIIPRAGSIMNSSQKKRTLLRELNRADSVLSSILEKIVRFNEVLKPIELNLHVNDFSSKGVLYQGPRKGIICVLSALIKGDPLAISFEALKGKGLALPSIIKSADRNESRSTCESILKIIESIASRNVGGLVVNIRWSTMPKILNQRDTIIIGTRYTNLLESEIREVINSLSSQGFEAYEDRGEFGGGLLTYFLLENISRKHKLRVLELTLSKEVANVETKVEKIIQVLSTL